MKDSLPFLNNLHIHLIFLGFLLLTKASLSTYDLHLYSLSWSSKTSHMTSDAWLKKSSVANTQSFKAALVFFLVPRRKVPTISEWSPLLHVVVKFSLLVAHLLNALPSVLKANRLSSTRDRSIFDGATDNLLVAEYLHSCGMPSFLLNLDFVHAYERSLSNGQTMSLKPWAFG